MRCFLGMLLVAGMASSSWAQSPLEPCAEIGPVYSSGTTTGTVQAYCITTKPASNSTSPTQFSGNQNIVLQSEIGATLKHGFSAGGFSATGGLNVQATANKVDAVALAPDNYNGTICMFEKLELGLQLPDSITALVDAYLANGSGGLNPFDPAHIDISGTVIKAGVSAQPVHAFYMQGYQVQDLDGNSKMDKIVNAPTNFNWRIRHAFTGAGTWTMSINATIAGVGTYPIRQLTVQVTDCGHDGYLTVGTENNNNDRYLRYSHSGAPFFALGHNLNEDRTYNYYVAHSTDSTYEYYNNAFAHLAANGGNYTRIWLTEQMLGLEYEQLGHYATAESHGPTTDSLEGLPESRQAAAYLFDEIVALAELHGIKLQLCIEASSYFTKNSDEWNLRNPYKVELGLTEPREFFLDSAARSVYKNKLRYIVARYGYSPAIAMWEFWNEYDHIWHYGGEHHYHKLDAPGAANRIAVLLWHDIMANYLKNDLGALRHPITTSLSVGENSTLRANLPFSLAAIDVVQLHIYALDQGANEERAQYIEHWLDVDYSTWQTNHQKPVFYGETGFGGELEQCYPPASKDMWWSSAFQGGYGAGLAWEGHSNTNLNTTQHLAGLATFLQGMDWIGPQWEQKKWVNGPKANKPFEAYHLVSGSSERAIGYVLNRTLHWSELRSFVPCIEDLIAAGTFNEGLSKGPKFRSGKSCTIKGLKSWKNYTTEWYNTTTGQIHSSETRTSGLGGKLRPTVPPTNFVNSDWAYKIYLSSVGSFKDAPVPNAVRVATDDERNNARVENAQLEEGNEIQVFIFPNPAQRVVTIKHFSDNGKLRFISIDGRRAYPVVENVGHGSCTVQFEKAGIYFVILEFPESVVARKIVIHK